MFGGRVSFGGAFLLLLSMVSVRAEGPFGTNASELLDPRAISLEAFTANQFSASGQSGSAASAQLQVGLLKNLELDVALPLGYSAPNRRDVQVSITQAEVGVRIGIVEEGSYFPGLSFAPSATLIIDPQDSGEAGTSYFLPFWLQKSWRDWTLYGGGGVRLAPSGNGGNTFFSGVVLNRKVNDTITLGVEAYREQEATGAWSEVQSGLNFGGTINVNRTLAVDLAVGPAWVGGEPATALFLGLNWTTEMP